MTPQSALQIVAQFASLQGRLVRQFIDTYSPQDRERFRDIADGTFSVDGNVWRHRRHGSGVLFLAANNVRVNAHVAMAEHPTAMDGGRLFEYVESLGLASLTFDQVEYQITKRDLDRMVDAMSQRGVLRAVVTPDRKALIAGPGRDTQIVNVDEPRR